MEDQNLDSSPDSDEVYGRRDVLKGLGVGAAGLGGLTAVPGDVSARSLNDRLKGSPQQKMNQLNTVERSPHGKVSIAGDSYEINGDPQDYEDFDPDEDFETELFVASLLDGDGRDVMEDLSNDQLESVRDVAIPPYDGRSESHEHNPDPFSPLYARTFVMENDGILNFDLFGWTHEQTQDINDGEVYDVSGTIDPFVGIPFLYQASGFTGLDSTRVEHHIDPRKEKGHGYGSQTFGVLVPRYGPFQTNTSSHLSINGLGKGQVEDYDFGISRNGTVR